MSVTTFELSVADRRHEAVHDRWARSGSRLGRTLGSECALVRRRVAHRRRILSPHANPRSTFHPARRRAISCDSSCRRSSSRSATSIRISRRACAGTREEESAEGTSIRTSISARISSRRGAWHLVVAPEIGAEVRGGTDHLFVGVFSLRYNAPTRVGRLPRRRRSQVPVPHAAHRHRRGVSRTMRETITFPAPYHRPLTSVLLVAFLGATAARARAARCRYMRVEAL